MKIRETCTKSLYISILILILIIFLSPPFSSASAAKEMELNDDKSLGSPKVEAALINRPQTLRDFIRIVRNGFSDDLVGVYVPGVLAFPIVDQPSGNYGYVSRLPDVITSFSLAEQYGSVGLLAHNDLAGDEYTKMLHNMRVILVYGDGSSRNYKITEIKYYRAIEPNSPYSNFEDLQNKGELISAENLFHQMYTVSDRVIFQTCVSANGIPSWGRVFIIAEQITMYSRSPYLYKGASASSAH